MGKWLLMTSLSILMIPAAIADDCIIFHEELIFSPTSAHTHSPSIVETPDGMILASWYCGSGERKANDVKILGSTLKPSSPYSSSTWSTPFILADTPGFPDCNSVLFVDAQERLWMFWSTILANEWGSSLLKYRQSSQYDGTRPPIWDWQDVLHVVPPDFSNDFIYAIAETSLDLPEFIPKVLAEIRYKNLYPILILYGVGLLLLGIALIAWICYMRKQKKCFYKPLICGNLLLFALFALLFSSFGSSLEDKESLRLGWLTRCKPLLLKNDKILLPLYSETYSISLIAITSDYGKSWQFSEPIIGMGNVQPALIEKADGTIVAYMRDNGYYARIRVSYSYDQGLTWSEVQSTDLPNSGASIDIEKLESGNWILVYNDLLKGRHRLKVSISDDEGKSWKWHRYLEEEESYAGRFCYPAIIQSRDGMIHCVYSYLLPNDENSIKHVQFNEEWVVSGASPAGT